MPISFLSKTLSKEQLNWKVPEKECYAIWYGLKKLEYLIRDVRFTLHTDHRNLTFLKTAGSDKVMRWKLEIQEYDCKVIFIKGEDNHIADNFSRLCAVETLDEDKQLCSVAEFNVYIPDKLKSLIMPDMDMGEYYEPWTCCEHMGIIGPKCVNTFENLSENVHFVKRHRK
jgi:hypothetical protein